MEDWEMAIYARIVLKRYNHKFMLYHDDNIVSYVMLIASVKSKFYPNEQLSLEKRLY